MYSCVRLYYAVRILYYYVIRVRGQFTRISANNAISQCAIVIFAKVVDVPRGRYADNIVVSVIYDHEHAAVKEIEPIATLFCNPTQYGALNYIHTIRYYESLSMSPNDKTAKANAIRRAARARGERPIRFRLFSNF